ncbi:pyridine nucleotide-disulfide oxidoreductase family protein [Francisella philomiragia]|uniref:NAD(P)/FAD-dependent oxidoreductase n=1 Tax=Francisella philomiragia TaxID=28110 RepID=UPI0005A57864|nr:NAD(P)/FAD-dependent oxidoreductase [Francisella philomiragia]AJI57277.1 pyridine nucleotide-disulfide oxidoreductase family protein [Francisella philomiragia]
MLNNNLKTTVAIIGAGPSGSVAAAILVKKGYDVIIIERQIFPRFSIGESLLPQSMQYFEEADMLDVIKQQAIFQHKNGAAFNNNIDSISINFNQKFTAGYGDTFQVKRRIFDKALANKAQGLGTKIFYNTEVIHVAEERDNITLTVRNLETQKQYKLEADFVLDASGFGRVLPKLLNLEKPSNFPMRQSYFCHIEDNITDESFDRNKILISIHPEHRDIWYWLIPFADGTSSIGVVAKPENFIDSNTNIQNLDSFIKQMPYLANLTSASILRSDVQTIKGYSSNVSKLYGERFALLGNAAEFLDPVFSSGITIAVKSASLAANALDRHLRGIDVDWQKEFVDELYIGINTFREFVSAWYEGSLQDIIFHKNSTKNIKEQIVSILAGYAWDKNNPFVRNPRQGIRALSRLCC